MTDFLEKLYGRVVSVTRQTYGSVLTANASIADTVLSVAATDDFDAESGGTVVIDGGLYAYVEVDEDASTITLDTGLLEAADEDTFVELYDPEVDGVVVEYVADVLLDDQDPGDEPIEVTVQHGLVNMLSELVRGGASESVVLVRDGDDDWIIWQIDGKLAVDVALEEAVSAIDLILEQLNSDLAELNDVTLPGVQADLAALNADLATLNGLFPITSTSISDGAITTPKMTANSINGDRILANSLNASKIVANSITGDRIAANTIGADRIVANSIGTDRLAANSVTADKIAAGAITAVAASGGGVTATLSGSTGPAGNAALSFSGSGFSHALYSSSGTLTLYSNNALTVTAPTVNILGDVGISADFHFVGSLPTTTSAPNLRVGAGGIVYESPTSLGPSDSGGVGYRVVRVPN